MNVAGVDVCGGGVVQWVSGDEYISNHQMIDICVTITDLCVRMPLTSVPIL